MRIDSFRTAIKADADSIALLVNKAYRPEPGTEGWTHESNLVSGHRINASQVAEAIARANSAVLLGLKGSDTIACVHVEKDGRGCRIGMLAVNPSLQGVGVGKQMLAYAENYGRANFGSEKFIMLVVSQRSELMSYYLRHGYQKTGAVMEFPLSAGGGIPKIDGLQIEVLEKQPNTVVNRG